VFFDFRYILALREYSDSLSERKESKAKQKEKMNGAWEHISLVCKLSQSYSMVLFLSLSNIFVYILRLCCFRSLNHVFCVVLWFDSFWFLGMVDLGSTSSAFAG
jgi:hypothetical protein